MTKDFLWRLKLHVGNWNEWLLVISTLFSVLSGVRSGWRQCLDYLILQNRSSVAWGRPFSIWTWFNSLILCRSFCFRPLLYILSGQTKTFRICFNTIQHCLDKCPCCLILWISTHWTMIQASSLCSTCQQHLNLPFLITKLTGSLLNHQTDTSSLLNHKTDTSTLLNHQTDTSYLLNHQTDWFPS